ncbi:MAG: alpha/beta fold hydrolase [Nocardioides sp.]
MAGTPVILLPGVVLPAALAYAGLIAALGDGFECLPKELEVYAAPEPPNGFGLDTEVEGIARAARGSRFDRFHLVGYSGGGASSLAFASTYPDRLLSLALLEPAWAGNEGLGPEEQAVWTEFDRIKRLPQDQRMPAFMRAQVASDTPLPPPPEGPQPPWMARRPAGIVAFLEAFSNFQLDLDGLRRFERPVYYAVGGRSNPDYFARQAHRLARVFPDFTVEAYDERHHFDPPHRTEPERLAAALTRMWART